MYHNMHDLIDVCVNHMANEHFTPDQVRLYMKDMLPKLNYWKQYKNLAGADKFEKFKKQLMNEINDLHIRMTEPMQVSVAMVPSGSVREGSS